MINKEKSPLDKDISELKVLLFNGEYKEFLNKGQKFKKKYSEQKLFEKVIDDPFYWFSFKSFSTDIKNLNKNILDREDVFLSLFRPLYQWEILGSVVFDDRDININIFKKAKNLFDDKKAYINNAQLILSVRNALSMLTQTLIFQDKWEEFDIMCKKTGWDLNKECQLFYCHYKYKNSRGAFQLNINTIGAQPMLFSGWFLINNEKKLNNFIKRGLDIKILWETKDELKKMILPSHTNERDKEYYYNQCFLSKSLIEKHMINEKMNKSFLSSSKKITKKF